MTERATLVPKLDILRRGELIRSVPMNKTRLVVGSEEGADLRLKHPAIANRHVEISVVDGRYLEAINLAGEGRVLLGGHPMSRARLRENDLLDLGPVTIRMSFDRSGRLARVSPEDVAAETTLDRLTSAESQPSVARAVEDEPTDPGSRAPFVPDPFLPPMPTPPPPSSRPRQSSAAVVAVPSPPPVRPGGVGPPPRGRPGSAAATQTPARSPADHRGAGGPSRPQPPPVVSPASSGEEVADVDLDDIVLDPTPVVVLEPTAGRTQRVPLRVGSFVIGAGRCAFRLTYAGVAPAHAEVMVMPDGVVYLKHLAGAGLVTLRNGAPIQFSRWASGDRVQVGPVSMRLELVARTELDGVVTQEPPETPPHGGDPRHPAAAHPAIRVASAVPSMAPRAAELPPPAPLDPVRVVEQPAALAGHAVPIPVVRVRAKKTRPPPTGPVLPNEVFVQLDVQSHDTFAAIAIDEHSRPRRGLGFPFAIVLLLGVVGAQAYTLWSKKQTPAEAPRGAPVTANSAAAIDEGPVAESGRPGAVRIGDPKLRRTTGGGGGATGGGRRSPVSDDGIDWGDVKFGEARADEDSRRIRGAEAFAAVGAKEEPAEGPGEADVSQGFVEMPVVEKVIYDNNKLLRGCYEQARERAESLRGKLWMTLTLQPDGRVRGAVAEPRSSMRDAGMEACLAKRLSTMTFPEPEGGSVTFSYPFDFQ